MKDRSHLELKLMRMENGVDRRLADVEGRMRSIKQEMNSLMSTAREGNAEAARKLVDTRNQLQTLEKSKRSLLLTIPATASGAPDNRSVRSFLLLPCMLQSLG